MTLMYPHPRCRQQRRAVILWCLRLQSHAAGYPSKIWKIEDAKIDFDEPSQNAH